MGFPKIKRTFLGIPIARILYIGVPLFMHAVSKTLRAKSSAEATAMGGNMKDARELGGCASYRPRKYAFHKIDGANCSRSHG